MNRIKVLAIATFPPPIHGSSMVSQFIIESKLIKGEFDIDCVNLSTSRKMNEIGKNTPIKLWRFIFSFVVTFWKLITNRYDLCYLAVTIHGKGFLKDFPYLMLARIFCKNRIIHQHNKGLSGYLEQKPFKWLYPIAYKNSKVMLLSWRLYEDISAVVEKEQVLICPNGLPLPKYLQEHPITMESRAGHNVPNILYLSNIVRSKGVYFLLNALKELKEKGIDFTCSFVGSESKAIDRSLFQKEIEKRHLEDIVFYLGPQYGDDKWLAFEKADIFVLPSMDDCLPLTIIEAMQCHLPVVASDMGAIPDLVVDGENGFIISSEEMIIESQGKYLDWNPSPSITKKIRESGHVVPHCAHNLAVKLEGLLVDRNLRNKMGEDGWQKYKKNFSLESFEKCICSNFKYSIK